MTEPFDASPDLLRSVLRRMARARLAELWVAHKYPEQKMRCPAHLCLGQELTGAAFAALELPGDITFGNYRSHGHYLAKGGDLKGMFAELLGLSDGCSGGIGGSMHLIDIEKGFHGSSAIVGSSVPIAAGASMKFRQAGSRNVAVVFFGDAALEEGVLYETANLAKLYRLPVIFVCENNRLAVMTPLELRASTPRLEARFESLGLPGSVVDGHDPLAMLGAASRAYETARGRGPAFLVCDVNRWAVHVGHAYEGPVDAWWQAPQDPAADGCAMARCARLLLDRKAATLADF
jgi:TPP-dependent pyruvate/acetoin dehydrogenase alpha subunit